MNGFRLKRALSIARKEVFHVARDPFTLALALGLPVFMVTFFGLAIDFNVKEIQLSVFDADKSMASRQLADTATSSQYFRFRYQTHPLLALEDMESERAKGALIIQRGFGQDLGSGRGAHAQILLDGADNSTVGVIQAYLGNMQQIFLPRVASLVVPPPVQLQTRFLFNPELNSQWFVIPGLTVVVLAIVSILLTSLTVAREWENGSMELLLSTPVQPLEIIVGKVLPYLGLGLAAVAFVYVVARLGFGVPFRGSHALFFLGCLLFLGCYLGQGILISVSLRRQQLAMQAAMMSGMLPSLLLSGFVFSIDDMPVFFRYFTGIFPARWFMEICRGIFLKGAGLREMGLPFAMLTLVMLFFIRMATRKFKKDLEP